MNVINEQKKVKILISQQKRQWIADTTKRLRQELPADLNKVIDMASEKEHPAISLTH